MMTLGGLALAVGILVDDATVDDREHQPQPRAGQAAASRRSSTARAQIAVPAFVSTLSICIVFVPMFLLTGVARYLFVPLARGGRVRDARVVSAVAHAGARRWRGTCCARTRARDDGTGSARPAVPSRLQPGSSAASSGLRDALPRLLACACDQRRRVVPARFLLVLLAALRCSSAARRRTSFPRVDAGQIRCTCARRPARASRRRRSALSTAVEATIRA